MSAAIIGAALLLCYFTVRPAPDYIPHTMNARAWVDRLSGAWDWAGLELLRAFSPWHFVGAHRELIAPWEHPSLLAAALTIILWLLAVSVLTARRSRWFFLSASVVWMALVWATVHIPGAFHSSFLFLAYVIALLANTPCEGERPWLPSRYARPVLSCPAGHADTDYRAVFGRGVPLSVLGRQGYG